MNRSFVLKLVLGILPLVWLSACADMLGNMLGKGQDASSDPVIEVPRTGVDTAFFIGYFRHINALYPDDLKREFRSTEEAFSRDESPVNRFRLAMLLSAPNTGFRDDARALALIKDYLKDPSKNNDGDEDGLNDLAFFMQSMLSERQSEALKLHQTEDRLREQQKHDAALQQQLKKQVEAYQKLDQRLKDEEKHRALLEQQLEALKSIEKSLRRNKAPAQAAEAGLTSENKSAAQGSRTDKAGTDKAGTDKAGTDKGGTDKDGEKGPEKAGDKKGDMK